jgi:hypothetical protein
MGLAAASGHVGFPFMQIRDLDSLLQPTDGRAGNLHEPRKWVSMSRL